MPLEADQESARGHLIPGKVAAGSLASSSWFPSVLAEAGRPSKLIGQLS